MFDKMLWPCVVSNENVRELDNDKIIKTVMTFSVANTRYMTANVLAPSSDDITGLPPLYIQSLLVFFLPLDLLDRSGCGSPSTGAKLSN